MRHQTALFMAMVFCMAAVALGASFEETEAAEQTSVLPQDVYPDADMIVTADAKGNTVVTFKQYGTYKVTEDHPSEWFTQTYSANTSITLRDLSTVQSEISIVYDGAQVNRLTLFSADDKASLNAAIDLHFKMVSGSISNLSIITISSGTTQYLSKSYDSMSLPFRSLDITLDGGEIKQYNPTSSMVSITDYQLNIGRNMVIHRLFTTGENGKYSNVSVNMLGGHVGYMTNITSKIGVLDYNIASGAVDYLCIGANSEHVSTRDYKRMATSVVTGDVSVFIGENVTVKKCIIGGGILNMPMILSNGERFNDEVTHMVVIDAPSITIYNDTAFLTDNRNSAYRLSGYNIGQNIYPSTVMDTFSFNRSNLKVYSDTGVWKSLSSCNIPVGGILSLNTNFCIQPGAVFEVDKGAKIYNSNEIILYGSLINNGDFINNSVIQCRSSSIIEGQISGIGYLAEYVKYTTPSDSLNVMSSRTAVVIDQEQMAPVYSISAILRDSNCSVSLALEGSQPIYGDRFTISLDETVSPESFDKAYRLYIKGIDASLLKIAVIDITLPTRSDMCTAVYVYNEDTRAYEVIGTSNYSSEVHFTAGANNKFYIQYYIDDIPNPNPQPVEEDISKLDFFLMAAIVAVLCVIVYGILTMRRD